MPWVYDPHSGGAKIPSGQHSMLRAKAEAFAKTRAWFSTYELVLRFKSQFCYLDAIDRADKKSHFQVFLQTENGKELLKKELQLVKCI